MEVTKINKELDKILEITQNAIEIVDLMASDRSEFLPYANLEELPINTPIQIAKGVVVVKTPSEDGTSI